MKYQITIISLFLVFGLIQKVNSQTESSWLENYEITQLASPEKDILVLSIKNSGKSKKDCLRKAKEQALFHLLFKGISINEISVGNNISPRKPIPFLEKFDQTDEKNGLNRFIRKTGFENIVDAEKDENIDGIKNEDKSKTFVSVIKLNARTLVTQLEDLNLKRTFIEELGFKPKILFIPGDLDQIESYLSNTETNPLVAEYNNQYNLINASLGKSFDLINIFSLREKLDTELSINHEKSAEFKEREIDIIFRVYVSNVILLLKHLPDKQSGLQAMLNPVLLSFTPVGKPILISDKETTKKTDLELIQIILSTETDLIIEDVFFNLIDQKGKTQNIKVELSCNKRIKKVIDEKIAHAENNLSFLEIIQDYFNSKGIKLIPDGKSNNQFYVTIENFKSPFIAQQEKFVDEITNLVAQKTGFTLDIDFTGNSLVRLELTEIKRLERQRKINSDYQRAISQKSLELHRQFLKEFPDAEYFSEMKGRYNDLISEKVKNRLSEEEYKLFLNDEFCTSSRNAVLVSYIEAQIPANWTSFSSMNDLKKVIQSVNQISQDYNYDYSYTQKYLSLSNLYNELINEKLKTKLSREEYSALLKDEYCTTSRNDVEISFIESLIPANWKEITTLKGINELVKNINSACKENNLTTSLMTNYCYSTSDFFDAGEWTFENLNVSHFINGDTIYEAKTNEEWIRANNEKRPAWCYYNNDENNKYNGKLYNYYAASDSRGLVNNNYKIPSIDDYENLFNRLGNQNLAGRKMKAIFLWGEELRDDEPFMDFTAKPTGYRTEKGAFSGNFFSNTGNGETICTGFWTSTQNGGNATAVYLQQNNDEAKVLSNSEKGNGWSVRVLQKTSNIEFHEVSLQAINEIQLLRDQLILKEYQTKKNQKELENFFFNQLKQETNSPHILEDEVDFLNYTKIYHRIWNNPKLVKNGIYTVLHDYSPSPNYGIGEDLGNPVTIVKKGYLNNSENFQEYDDGSIYKGAIVNGVWNGEGSLTQGEYLQWGSSEGDKYQGTFKNGEFLKGKISYVNGNSYEGECQYYQPNGQGKLTLANGQVQQGKFVNGEFIKPFTCKEAKIGNQIWMAENLNVSTFRNGDLIPHITSFEEWETAGKNHQPAWCYFDNNEENGKIYGKLFNWYAVNDPRGLAPEGWHVPTSLEWDLLLNSLGSISDNNSPALKLKSKSCLWADNCNTYLKDYQGNNSTGFNALPAGVIIGPMVDDEPIGLAAGWWTSDTDVLKIHYIGDEFLDAISFEIWQLQTWINRPPKKKSMGLSVRCVKD